MRKKLFAKLAVCLLAGCLALGLVACGGGKNEQPVIYHVTVQAEQGATYGAVNDWHVLTYRADNCDEVTVYVMKDGNATTDYEFDKKTERIRFTAAGNYTVVLGAKNGDKTSAACANITVGGSQGQPSGPDDSNPSQPNGIVLGTDPFGGTCTSLVPNVGMLLYYDATYNGAQVAQSSVSYSVISGSATIEKVNNDDNYRYLVATAAGTVKVRITVSVSGEETKTAEQTFTVTATADYETYGKSVYNGALGLNLDNGTGNTSTAGRNTLVLTKNGVIANRNGSASLDGVLGLVNVGAVAETFSLTFDVTVISNYDDWNSLGMPLFNEATHLGNFWINWNGKDEGYTGVGGSGDGTATNDVRTNTPAPAGTVFKVRFTRSVSGSTVSFKAAVSFNGGASYTEVASRSGSVGSSTSWAQPITNISLNHWDGGIYMISNIATEAI